MSTDQSVSRATEPREAAPAKREAVPAPREAAPAPAKREAVPAPREAAPAKPEAAVSADPSVSKATAPPVAAPAKPEAAALKDEGNAKFKAGEFKAAVAKYSQCVELEPENHVHYSNRSAARLKVGDDFAEDARADAERCVQLNPNFVKGYSRFAAALQVLKRWDDALAICEKGISVTNDESLKKMREEVKNRKFFEDLRGTWHGKVHKDLGHYDQEMEFLDNSTVRVEVLGRSIVGSCWVDCANTPFQLNIQVPMQDAPPGMPPPPPVPYIAKIDREGLHLCCPYLMMQRPTTFEGPGYCLMKKGNLPNHSSEDLDSLSLHDKLVKCSEEMVESLPDHKLEDVQPTDSEEVAGQKLMQQVQFESSRFALQKRFGEGTFKLLVDATRGELDGVPESYAKSKELKALKAKLVQCGILEESPGPGTAVSAAAKPPAPVPEPPKVRAAATPPTGPTSSDLPKRPNMGKKEEADVPVGLIAIGAVAVAAIAFFAWRKSKN